MFEDFKQFREHIKREQRAALRRKLYREDPLWRLSKLKANRETRLRAQQRQAEKFA